MLETVALWSVPWGLGVPADTPDGPAEIADYTDRTWIVNSRNTADEDAVRTHHHRRVGQVTVEDRVEGVAHGSQRLVVEGRLGEGGGVAGGQEEPVALPQRKEKLKAAAVGMALGVLRDKINESVPPQVRENVNEMMDRITVKQGDSDAIPTGGGTGGSRSIPIGGSAVMANGHKMIDHGKNLAAGTAEGVLRLIDVATGKDRLDLPGHTGLVGGVAFAPDGRAILTAGDRSVRQWEVSGWRQQIRFEHPNVTASVAVSPCGGLIAA